MNEPVYVSLPEDTSNESLRSHFQQQLHELKPALDDQVEDSDPRAVVDNIEIVAVYRTGQDVQIDYIVHFSAYYGCDDRNYVDSDERSVNGIIGDDWLVLESFVPRLPRDTYEEF
jgi:hypothetical protein